MGIARKFNGDQYMLMKNSIENIKQMATGRWTEILTYCGGLTSKQLCNRHQPCPLCQGTDRYRFDNKNGSGSYYCNNCGAGDGWSLLMKVRKWDFLRAVTEVERYLGSGSRKKSVKVKLKDVKEETTTNYQVVIPVPDVASPFLNNSKKARLYCCAKSKLINVSYEHLWDWFDIDQNRIGYIGRYSKPRAGKVVHQILYVQLEDSTKCWAIGSIPNNRPLVGEHLIKPEHQRVIVVEGETTRDAVQNLFPEIPVITWVGGSNAVSKSNWDAVKDKDLIIVPDNDEAGLKAVLGYYDKYGELKEGILHKIQGLARTVKVVSPPADKPEGWDFKDAVDEGWSREQMEDYMEKNERSNLEPLTMKKAQEKEVNDTKVIIPLNDTDATKESGITFLGYRGNTYYFISKLTNEIIDLKPRDMTKLNLISLADIDYFASRFPASGKEDVNWTTAAQWLMRRAAQNKYFNPNRVRGRGGWVDNSKLIYHLGDRLLIDGELKDLTDIQSRYCYIAGEELSLSLDAKYTENDYQLLEKMLTIIPWQSSQSKDLLQGWLVTSVICGFLDWRSSIWLLGPAGSGKSQLISKIIMPILGDHCLPILGDSSEAGIRQELVIDALPVIFDECEGEDESSNVRIQKLLSLSRHSSTQTGMKTLKGSAGHKSVSFEIRSSFCFGSTNVTIKSKPDWDRFTILAVQRIEVCSPKDEERIAAIVECISELSPKLDKAYSDRFIARAVRLAPVIRHNAKMLAKAVTQVYKSGRFGDQIGTLLAGKHSLISEEQLSIETALDFVKQFDLTPYTEPLEISQEKNALSILLQYEIEYEDSDDKRHKMTVGEAIEAVCNDHKHDDSDEILKKLKAIGIDLKFELEGWYIYISNSSQTIAKAFAGTAFANGWSKVLINLPSAEKTPSNHYFCAAINQRGVTIAYSSIRDWD